jgi:hypothetical protein
LDTRPKIVSPADIRRGGAKIVVGYFDPLFSDTVIRLKQISDGERVDVIVVDRAGALLPLRARGELVAALSCVDRVVLCDGDVSQMLAQFSETDVFDERESDERRARQLSVHIVERYKPE